MFFDNSVLQNPKSWLVPTAWSLGVELQAYLILPFVIYFKKVKIVLSIASLLIFCAASMGFLDSDLFGYRLLPGILFFFVAGVSIFRNTSKNNEADLFDKLFPAFAYAILVILLIVLGISKMLSQPYVKETIFGFLVGMPIITYLANKKVNTPINHFLGDLSYGLFLSHLLAMWIIQYYSLIDKSKHLHSYVFVVFLISLTISLIGILVIEKGIKKYRFRLLVTKRALF
jgi:peptidoglycan/LPS O-acetylase OafA/YrhL